MKELMKAVCAAIKAAERKRAYARGGKGTTAMIHQLKTEENFFDDVTTGKKPFEVRKNDRDFMVGDYLALNEVETTDGIAKETGRCCIVKVSYILNDERFVKNGMVILGIDACSINNTANINIYGTREKRHG